MVWVTATPGAKDMSNGKPEIGVPQEMQEKLQLTCCVCSTWMGSHEWMYRECGAPPAWNLQLVFVYFMLYAISIAASPLDVSVAPRASATYTTAKEGGNMFAQNGVRRCGDLTCIRFWYEQWTICNMYGALCFVGVWTDSWGCCADSGYGAGVTARRKATCVQDELTNITARRYGIIRHVALRAQVLYLTWNTKYSIVFELGSPKIF